jgi:hypothetical protein
MKDEDQKRYVQVFEKLRASVEAADEGSPELDREIAAVFPSAPPGVSSSIDAVVNLLDAALRNWWWTCGYCKATNDASLYSPGSYNVHASFGPDGSLGGETLRLIYDKKWGPCLDHGFHRDRQGGTVPLSMLSVFSTGPDCTRRSQSFGRFGGETTGGA